MGVSLQVREGSAMATCQACPKEQVLPAGMQKEGGLVQYQPSYTIPARGATPLPRRQRQRPRRRDENVTTMAELAGRRLVYIHDG